MASITVETQLVHHSAAASSSSKTFQWIPSPDSYSVDESDNDSSSNRTSSIIVYASHGLLNVCISTRVVANQEPLWKVQTSLRSRTRGETKRIVSAIGSVVVDQCFLLLSGFSDGTAVCWQWVGGSSADDSSSWKERVLVDTPSAKAEIGTSVTDICGSISSTTGTLSVITCGSKGASLLQIPNWIAITTSVTISHSPSALSKDLICTKLSQQTINTVQIFDLDQNTRLILVGTAAPRHNKIHVHVLDSDDKCRYVGFLLGHEDWLTDFDLSRGVMDDNDQGSSSKSLYLASSSQDCKIRLWEFSTSMHKSNEGEETEDYEEGGAAPDVDAIIDEAEDDNFRDEEEEEDGEARLEIFHSESQITKVILEALLIGHEEPITSVAWHPNPQGIYGTDRILLSSSMDRTLFIWAASSLGSVWTPITRVGGAGGILGGSIGSTLLGFVGAAIEPKSGRSLAGQAYGGAIHFWSLERKSSKEPSQEDDVAIEEIALLNTWKATPCITGHFDAVTDLCWEASRGAYLLTVSKDQTCRLWSPLETEDGSTWIELARPQVHGYDLACIVSISTTRRQHMIVSGADEQELRTFDAPLTTTKLLEKTGVMTRDGDTLERVERAYIPALGLSNKASAADAADEDTEGNSYDGGNVEGDIGLKLPLERDLGVVSLWPEVEKLFGHKTELFCLATNAHPERSDTEAVFVASAAKAREPEDANIRIWNVVDAKMEAVLEGGHKSTVATMAFSPDKKNYLVSSGKDRRLCLWKQDSTSNRWSLLWAKEAAHKRIIWSVHFCPHDRTLLTSGSRDGTVKLWRLEEDSESDGVASSLREMYSFTPNTRYGQKAEAVTAVSFASHSSILAVGLETGDLELWSVGPDSANFIAAIPYTNAHSSGVTKLAWRPTVHDEENEPLLLASCSSDHGCRLIEVKVE